MRRHNDLFYGVKPSDPFKKLDSEIIINDWRKHEPVHLSIYSFPIGIPARVIYRRNGKNFQLDTNSLSLMNGKTEGKLMLLDIRGKRTSIKMPKDLIERVTKRLPPTLSGLKRKTLRMSKEAYVKPRSNIDSLVLDFVITYGSSVRRTQPYMGLGKMADYAAIGDTHDTIEIPNELNRHPSNIDFRDAIAKETYLWVYNLVPLVGESPTDVDNRVWEPFLQYNVGQCKYLVGRRDYIRHNCFYQLRDAVVSAPIKGSIKTYKPAHRLKGRTFKVTETRDKKGARVLLSSASDMGKYGAPNLWYSLSVIRCHKGKDFRDCVRSTKY